MKELDLTVYGRCRKPECADAIEHYAGEYGLTPWDAVRLAQAKHLTDPELAAEYWAAELDHSVVGGGYDPARRAYRIRETFERFTTTPSYDQEGQ